MKPNIFCITAIMGLAATPALAQDPHSSDTIIVADTVAVESPFTTVETDTVAFDEGNMQDYTLGNEIDSLSQVADTVAIDTIAAPAMAVETDTVAFDDENMQDDFTRSNEIDSLRQAVDEMKSQMEATSAAQEELIRENEQRRIWKDRAKYFNIAYVNQSLTHKDIGATWHNDLGAALSMGRTYYLHKKPILGMIKFGLDWTYFDLNYSKYKDEWGFFNGSYEDSGFGNYWYSNSGSYEDDDDLGSEDVHQAEIGMGIGLSVTINPYDEIKIAGHFRVIPTYSMLYAAEDFSSSYGTFFSLGGSIAWKAISLGIEARWGHGQVRQCVQLGRHRRH